MKQARNSCSMITEPSLFIAQMITYLHADYLMLSA